MICFFEIFQFCGVQVFEVWPSDFWDFLGGFCYVRPPFLILLVWIFSLSLYLVLIKVYWVFSKKQLLVSLILYYIYILVVSISSPKFGYFLTSISLGCACFVFDLTFWRAFELLVFDLFDLFMQALSVMNFPLRAAFIVSLKFVYAVCSFFLNSRMSLISLFLPWLKSFIFHEFEGFLLFPLLKSNFNPWWSDECRWLCQFYCIF